MSKIENKTMGLLALGALLLSTGCTTRSVVRFEDHPKQNQTYVETYRHDNYFVSQSMTHEFWLCKDEEAQLTCKRTCDGSTDLACPAIGSSVEIAGSNVR